MIPVQALQNVPIFTCANEAITKAYHLALHNLLEINTVDCPAETYNRTGLLDETLGKMIRAGAEYDTPWTRDAAVNTMNAACFIIPRIAKNTLWAVCERSEGELFFQLDNQNWDKIIWATGAWAYYLATGEKEFMALAYETITNSLAVLENTQFNPVYGLFTGGSFFNDGITGYPADVHEEGNDSSFVGDHPAAQHIMTLSTNCLYYHAYCILEEMAKILGKEYKDFARKGGALKQAIHTHLWDDLRSTYAYFLYPDGRKDTSQEGCGLSFAALYGVCEKDKAAAMLDACVTSEHGLVSIWPPFEGISSIEKPLRHNNLIWPVVNGFYTQAAAKCGLVSVVEKELTALVGLVEQGGGRFNEIYDSVTGETTGGWQCNRIWDSILDQTWSATGYIGSLIYGVCGITLDARGISFHPCVPAGLGDVSLKQLKLRDLTLDMTIKGCGARIAKILIDGQTMDRLAFDQAGHHTVQIEMAEQE